jgi:hypothetical protein
MNWKDLVRLVASIVIASGKVPHGDKLIPLIVDGIDSAEALKNAPTGEEKLAHATQIAKDGIAAINEVQDHEVIPVETAEKVQDTISSVVDIVNTIQDAQWKPEDNVVVD